jgi:hypothetical protein
MKRSVSTVTSDWAMASPASSPDCKGYETHKDGADVSLDGDVTSPTEIKSVVPKSAHLFLC